jgi:hypothetical protein
MLQPDSGISKLEQPWQLIQDLTIIQRERERERGEAGGGEEEQLIHIKM